MKYILLSLILIAIMYIGSKIADKILEWVERRRNVKDKR